jgi:hypothetical protein
MNQHIISPPTRSRITLRLLWLFLMTITCTVVNADSDRFTTSLSQSNLSVGDQFQITFTINGANAARGFKAPSFQDFNTIMGPSQSSNMTIVNGSFSQSLSITYVLQATKEGTFKIGGAEIMVGNDRLISNTVTVTVTKGGTRSGANSGQGGSSDGSSNVFLRASVDKNNAYTGEAIVVTYRLYTKVQLLNYSLDKIPNLTGFFSQDIALPQQPVFHRENVDGTAYDVAEIKKMVVFPQRSGSLEIDAMHGEVIARVQVKQQRSNDPFNQFFNDPFSNPFFGNVRDVKVPLNSAPLKITVKELPTGAPASFSGAVGKFSSEVSLDKTSTKSNEPVTLRIKISGKGNLKLIDAPSIEFPPDMETYDPKESVNITATAAGVTGSKTFEYLMIPRTGGEYKIPVQTFAYFDLDKRQYVEIPSPELVLKVAKGSETSTTTVTTVNKSDVQLLGKDIRFIKTDVPHFIQQRSPLWGSFVFYCLLLLIVGLSLGTIFLLNHYRKKMSNTGWVRSQRASKTALKRLSQAKKHLDQQQRDQFLDELSRSLWGFVSDKLGIPLSDLSKETVGAALLQQSVAEELTNEFIAVTDSCEFARFAGSVSAGNDLESLYQKGLSLITQLEQSISA